jgi:hypothetical protein
MSQNVELMKIGMVFQRDELGRSVSLLEMIGL